MDALLSLGSAQLLLGTGEIGLVGLCENGHGMELASKAMLTTQTGRRIDQRLQFTTGSI